MAFLRRVATGDKVIHGNHHVEIRIVDHMVDVVTLVEPVKQILKRRILVVPARAAICLREVHMPV